MLALAPANDPARGELTERLAASIYKQGEQARAAGLRLAVCTASTPQNMALAFERHAIDRWVDTVVSPAGCPVMPKLMVVPLALATVTWLLPTPRLAEVLTPAQ